MVPNDGQRHKMMRKMVTLLERKRSGVPVPLMTLLTMLDTDNTVLMRTLSEKYSSGDY